MLGRLKAKIRSEFHLWSAKTGIEWSVTPVFHLKHLIDAISTDPGSFESPMFSGDFYRYSTDIVEIKHGTRQARVIASNVTIGLQSSSTFDPNKRIYYLSNGKTLYSIGIPGGSLVEQNSPLREYYEIEYVECSAQKSVILINEIEPSHDLKLTLIPNPSNTGRFVIALDGADQASFVEVYNLLGSKVYAEANVLSGTEVNLSRPAPGTYIVRIAVKNDQRTMKLIIK